jgi:hypothetical protein
MHDYTEAAIAEAGLDSNSEEAELIRTDPVYRQMYMIFFPEAGYIACFVCSALIPITGKDMLVTTPEMITAYCEEHRTQKEIE